MIRAFIALTPSVTLQQSFADVQAALQRLSRAFRWVKPTQVHLTLKFLGDIPPETVAPIARAMQQSVTTLAPFTMSVRGLGCFPHSAHPRILWMGVDAPPDTLQPLHLRLETALTPLGFTPDNRPFLPHLTLARGQQRVNSHQLTAVLEAYRDRHFGEMCVEHVSLLQSQLYRDGAVYTMLRSVSLQHEY